MMSVIQMLNSIDHGLGNIVQLNQMQLSLFPVYRNSPVKYPTPSYDGPPIPIDFGDSSFECDSSPEKIPRLEDLPSTTD